MRTTDLLLVSSAGGGSYFSEISRLLMLSMLINLLMLFALIGCCSEVHAVPWGPSPSSDPPGPATRERRVPKLVPVPIMEPWLHRRGFSPQLKWSQNKERRPTRGRHRRELTKGGAACTRITRLWKHCDKHLSD